MFWEVFSSLCAERGEDPTPLAVKIGFSNAAASYWKSGKVPRGNSLKKIADYFGVTTDYLLGKTDKKNKSTAETMDFEWFMNLSPENRAKVMERAQVLLEDQERKK